MGISPSQHDESSGSVASGNNQAQSNRAPAPHMFHEIVAQEKNATADELEDQMYTGIYLSGITKVNIYEP